jgi:hypothetical protein
MQHKEIPMATLCGPGCGYCGMCTAAWEREDDDTDQTEEPMGIELKSDEELEAMADASMRGF